MRPAAGEVRRELSGRRRSSCGCDCERLAVTLSIRGCARRGIHPQSCAGARLVEWHHHVFPFFDADSHRALARRARRRRPRPHLRGAHVRLPDERPRLRAALRLARERRLRAGRGRRRGRRRRHQHLRRPRQRRRQAVRHARPPEVPQGQARRHADRRRRMPRADGQGHGPRQGAVGRRRLRHAQHGVAPEPPRARAPQRRGRARDPRVARDLPLDASHQARLGLQRLGRRSRSAATTPARSASCRACAAKRRIVAPATS